MKDKNEYAKKIVREIKLGSVISKSAQKVQTQWRNVRGIPMVIVINLDEAMSKKIPRAKRGKMMKYVVFPKTGFRFFDGSR